MARPVWFVKLIQKFFPQRFVFAKFTQHSLIGRAVDQGLFQGDDIIYLPRDGTVKSIQIQENVHTAGDVVLPSQVLEHFIDRSNYH